MNILKTITEIKFFSKMADVKNTSQKDFLRRIRAVIIIHNILYPNTI